MEPTETPHAGAGEPEPETVTRLTLDELEADLARTADAYRKAHRMPYDAPLILRAAFEVPPALIERMAEHLVELHGGPA